MGRGALAQRVLASFIDRNFPDFRKRTESAPALLPI
jgi:hypothetical protein